MNDERSLRYLELALDHSWSWFNLHATQRLQMLNFWLVSVAFLTGAFVAAVSAKAYGAAVGVSVGGAVASACFYRLEKRTRLLLRIGEAPMARLQRELAMETGLRDLEMLNAAENERSAFTSYGIVIRTLEWFTVIAFSIAALASGWIWHRS